MRPASSCACTPTGRSQPPPKRRAIARSSCTARRVATWSIAVQSSPVRAHTCRVACTTTAPCPASGTSCSTSIARMSCSPASTSPSRRSPAIASTRPASPRSAARWMRVATLPRIGRGSRSARTVRSPAMRRALPVPSVAPSGSSSRSQPALTSASRGSSRGSHAASTSPAVSSSARSLLECTAASIDPSSSCRSSACAKMPRSWISRSSRWSTSPSLVISTSSTSRSGSTSAIASRTSDAWCIASGLRRVPSRSAGRVPAARSGVLIRCAPRPVAAASSARAAAGSRSRA